MHRTQQRQQVRQLLQPFAQVTHQLGNLLQAQHGLRIHAFAKALDQLQQRRGSRAFIARGGNRIQRTIQVFQHRLHGCRGGLQFAQPGHRIQQATHAGHTKLTAAAGVGLCQFGAGRMFGRQ